VYGGPVVHLKDASQNSLALAKLMNPSLHDAYTKELNELYQKLREKHEGESKELVSLEEANKQKLNLF
jgi:5-methyltetrahydrofolate--homocysteine methyltransferase